MSIDTIQLLALVTCAIAAIGFLVALHSEFHR